MASGTGPRLPMTVGPIVGGIGLLLFMRVGANPDYLTEVLPAVVVFGLGLSAMVAPLTATVLDSVDERHTGIASGINNGVSRVAGLLAIAVLGAVIAGQFGAAIDDDLAGVDLGPAAEDVVADAQAKPLGAAEPPGSTRARRATVTAPSTDASVSSFHLGDGHRRRADDRRRHRRRDRHPQPAAQPGRTTRAPPRAATAGECGRCDGDPAGYGAATHEQPEPAPAVTMLLEAMIAVLAAVAPPPAEDADVPRGALPAGRRRTARARPAGSSTSSEWTPTATATRTS